MGERAIITGGTGFVGANLARHLLICGHEVHLLERPAHADWRIREIASDLQVHEVDVTDREGVRAALLRVRPTWVFHLAAHGAYSYQTDPERIVTTNVLGCMAALDASIEAGVAAFVHTGSSSEYGYRSGPSAESDRIAPNSVYAIGKAAATQYCQLIARRHDFHAVTLRLYSVYGPYEEPLRLVPTLLVHGRRGSLPPLVSPKTARDYVYVDDVANALLMAAQSPAVPRGSIYNVCTGVQTTLAAIAGRVCEQLAVPAEPVWGGMPPRPWDTDVWVGDPSLAARELGWKATTGLPDGLARTAQWLGESEDRIAFYEEQIFRVPSPPG